MTVIWTLSIVNGDPIWSSSFSLGVMSEMRMVNHPPLYMMYSTNMEDYLRLEA